MSHDQTTIRLLEAVRAACLAAAQTAGTAAMFDGLCVDGIVEVMCDAIRSVDVAVVANDCANIPATR